MKKQEFLSELRRKLSGMPKSDVEERIAFYSEMIDDRIEDGDSEEAAVLEIGDTDTVAEQIIQEIPLTKICKERIKPKRRIKAWEILLLILGSPLWLSLAVAAVAVFLSLYAVLWSLLLSVWAVFGALLPSAFACIAAGGFFLFTGNALVGVAVIGASFACLGIDIFLFFGCKAATKGVILLTRKVFLAVKKCFIQKEDA